MKQERIVQVLLILLGLGVVGLAILILPGIAEDFAQEIPNFAYLKSPILILVYLTLIPFLLAIKEGWGLLGMAAANVIFSQEADKKIHNIGKYSFFIFLIYSVLLLVLIVLKVPFSPAYLTILILNFATLAISVMAKVLRKLLNIAVEYKEYNDLTI